MIQSGNSEARLLVAALAVAGLSGSTGVFASMGNPWGVDVIVTRAILRSTVVASAVATLDIGPATDAVTGNDTLFDGLDVNAGTGIFDNLNDTHNGTNGLSSVLWGASQFMNVQEKTGNINGLVAVLYIEAVPAILGT